MNRISAIISITAFVCLCTTVFAQPGARVDLRLRSEIHFPFPKQAMTVAAGDSWHRNLIFVAGKGQGLLIYDCSSLTQPVLLKTIPIALLGDIEVISVTQQRNYLYLALGNIFTDNQPPGMAIIDIETPSQATVVDVFKLDSVLGGAGIVVVDEEAKYAYLGAMMNGLVVLDIANKSDITFVSRFVPSISFPNPVNPDPLKYNARGMQLIDNTVYLCYDAGGLRIVDVTNKITPVEIGRYSLPILNNRPRAYNNVLVARGAVFVATDYCGMEILDASKPDSIKQIAWWNPWACHTPANTWFNSPGHANELQMGGFACPTLFVSTGHSQISAVDVTTLANPELAGRVGHDSDKQGVWGVGYSEFRHTVFAAYIYVPLGIPFFSNWGGVKIFEWVNPCSLGVGDSSETSPLGSSSYPNPSTTSLRIMPRTKIDGVIRVIVTDASGKEVHRTHVVRDADGPIHFDHSLAPGLYFARLVARNVHEQHKFIVAR